MRAVLFISLALFLSRTALCQTAAPSPPCVPVNPDATGEARALLKKLCAVSGKYILSGQHNFPNRRSQHSDRLAAMVGKYPLVWGSDFGFTDGEGCDSVRLKTPSCARS